MATKRKNPPDRPSSPKKLKPSSESTIEPASESMPFVSIRLSAQTQNSLDLRNPRFLMIQNIQYLEDISQANLYLYDIVSRVACCSLNVIKLYRQSDGERRDEDADGWVSVDHDGNIEGGHYLCVIPQGKILSLFTLILDSCMPIDIDPVLASRGGNSGSRCSSASSSRVSSPELELSTSNQTESPTRINFLKDALENQTMSDVMEVIDEIVQKAKDVNSPLSLNTSR